MNFIKFGLISAQEKQAFLDTRKAWKGLGKDDLAFTITEQEEALKFQHWMNRVMPRPSLSGVRLHEDNVRFLRHTYASRYDII